MTLPQGSLHPASSDYRGPLLCALEFVARGDMQLAQIAGTVVGESMSFEPCPQIFDGIQVWRVRRQERNLNVSVQTVEILAHQATAMRPQAIPDDQQWL